MDKYLVSDLSTLSALNGFLSSQGLVNNFCFIQVSIEAMANISLSHLMLNRRFKIAGVLCWLLAIMAAIIALQRPRLQGVQDVPRRSTATQLQQQSDALKLQLQITQNLPTFGFDNMVANWHFLSFLQYFGDVEVRRQTGYLVSPEFFRIIIDRDPFFFVPYIYLSTSTSLFAAQPQVSVDLTSQGLSHLRPHIPPEAGVIWRYKGVDQLLFLGLPDEAIRSYQTAAEWAEQSPLPHIQATAELSRQTAAHIQENPDSSRTLVVGWSQILSQAIDETTFNLAVDQIEALGGQVILQPTGQITVRIPTDLD